MSYPSYPYTKEKSRPTELPSRGLPFVEKIGREEARGRGERTLLQKGLLP